MAFYLPVLPRQTHRQVLSSCQCAAGGGAWRSHPRLRFTFRFACLGLLRLCAAGTRRQHGVPNSPRGEIKRYKFDDQAALQMEA